MEIDEAIGGFTQSRNVADVLAMLDVADVPGGRICTAKDMAEDPHYRVRFCGVRRRWARILKRCCLRPA